MKIVVLVILLLSISVFAEDKIEYVLYTQEGCVPCQRIKAALKELNIKTIEGALSPRDGIREIPVIIIIINGEEKKRIVGFTTKEKLEEELLIDRCVPRPALRKAGLIKQ